MSRGLDNLRARLNYQGGVEAEGRIQQGKLNTLKKTLFNSYQAETAILSDGREFKCLINPNKLNTDYDDNYISIPFEDIRIGTMIETTDPETGDITRTEVLNKPARGKTTTGIETIGMKAGDVFEWKETNTYWLVYLRYLEEKAYFRAIIRQCTGEIDIDGTSYRVYVRGPAETEIQWNQKNNTSWNDINYSLVVYITKNQETLDFFHRFSKVKIKDETGQTNTWEVAVVNPYYGDGIIEICLNEYFNNEMEDARAAEIASATEPVLPQDIYIDGKPEVQPYDVVSYSIVGTEGGEWVLDTKKAKVISSADKAILIEITTGKSGSFDLTYKVSDDELYTLPIVIKSL
jgi:hypothetical protein